MAVPRQFLTTPSVPTPSKSLIKCSRARAWLPTVFDIPSTHRYISFCRSWTSRAVALPPMATLPSAGDSANGTSVAAVSAVPDTSVCRIGEVKRKTKETNVYVRLNLDGTGESNCSTGIPFLDHMLDQLASHGLFDVIVKASGDTHIDDHHTNEDVALAIGTALLQALGDRKGISRFGNFSAPLDEAAINVILDLSGRPHLSYDLQIPTQRVGTYDTQLVEHFFQSLVNTSGMTLHIRQFSFLFASACWKELPSYNRGNF